MDDSVGKDQGIIINVLRAAPTQNFLDDVEYCKRNEEERGPGNQIGNFLEQKSVELVPCLLNNQGLRTWSWILASHSFLLKNSAETKISTIARA